MTQAPEKFTCQKLSQPDSPDTTCLFYNKPGTSTNLLRNASTGDLDTKVMQCAIDLEDQYLLAKLSRGNVVGTDMKYHPKCLIAFYNRNRAQASTSQKGTTPDTAGTTAFAELISYMQEVLGSDDAPPVFQFSELSKLYSSRLHQLDEDAPSNIHSSRFKNRILGYIPELEAHSEGRDILLVPSGTAGKSIRKMCQLNGESETIIMSRVADSIRCDMFTNECPSFDGTFTGDCQQRSVPSSLHAYSSYHDILWYQHHE